MANADLVEDASQGMEQSTSSSGKRKNLLMGSIVLGIMLAEGAGIFFVTRHFAGSPSIAAGAAVGGLDAKAGEKHKPETELEVVRFRAQNERSQQLRVYDISVAAVFEEKESHSKKGEGKEEAEGEKEGEKEGEGAKPTSKVAELLGRKKATLQDRFGRIVRSMDPQRFSEPDLATLRELFKKELQQVVGEEAVVKELLIPSITRSNED